ncbi:flagellar motor protein [Thermodesulfovibrio hydrogeniphilus]
MDFLVIFGLIVGLSAVVVGNIIEGGTTAHLIQLAAGVIVFGGTFGAVIVSFSWQDLLNALKGLKIAFDKKKFSNRLLIEEIISLLVIARKRGILAMEREMQSVEHPFLKKGIGLLIDGYDREVIKNVLLQEIKNYEDTIKRAAKVFESAGGYAPTIGIIGAVLGLIQVLQNVSDPSRIGSGIATAFVATIYGVGSANLVFIPIGKRIINKAQREILSMYLILEGVLGIEAGINPHYLRSILESYQEGRDL